MSREELRADLLDDHGYCVNCGEDAEDCECAFEEFIDAILDAGYRKLSLDDATVERAAQALDPQAWDEAAIMWVAHGQSPEDARAYRQTVAKVQGRAVLAAAVEAGQ